MTVKILGWLRDSRVTAWVSLVPLVYFVAEWVVSASWRGFYGYRADPVGPLGIAFCGPAGNWPCSGLYPVMNVALVVTGVAVAFVAVSFLAQRSTDRGHAILLLAAGLGLATSGVITQQVDYSWNLTAITVFMTLGAVSVLFVALSSTSRLTVERRGIAVLAGVVSLIGYFAYSGGLSAFGYGGAQRMAIYGILVAVIALGTVELRSTSVDVVEPAEAAEAAEAVEELR